MVRLMALYKKPDDPDAFMKHYEEVHMPLVKRTSGLKKIVVNRVTAKPDGRPVPLLHDGRDALPEPRNLCRGDGVGREPGRRERI